MTHTNIKTKDNAQAAAAQDELFLVDGSGYIFRAFFALPQNLTNPEGVPIGAVLGFTNMLLKLLDELHAPNIAVIFDAARQNFRNEIYSEYKANRDETPEPLVPQFPLIREATKAFGIPALEVEGYEADDLIATYARLATERGQPVTIVGTDKDLMQLVTETVRMYDPIKGRYLTREDVEKKFGVGPEKVTDVQALCGDSTDNIPGVPGIGVKTAAALINEFGDLQTLLENAETIPQTKRRERLIEHSEDAIMSHKLVMLDRHAPVPLALEEMEAHDPHTPELAAFLKQQGFKTLLARLGATGTAEENAVMDAPAVENMPPVKDNSYELITTMAALEQWVAAAYEEGCLCIDTETTDLTPARAKLVGISLAVEPGKAAYIPLQHIQQKDLLDMGEDQVLQLPLQDVVAALKPVLEDESVLKIGHNIKYDWQILAAHGIEMTSCDDTMLLSYVLNGSEHRHGMDKLADLYLGHETIKYADIAGKGAKQVTFDHVDINEALTYAAEDADITLRLHKIFKPRLMPEGMTSVYEDIERPLIDVIARMEREGVRVDPVYLKALSADFNKRLQALEKDIYALAGHEFNIASPKQIGEVLFDEMGLEGGKKTKTGAWSTSAGVLEDLGAQGVEIVQKILDWRQLAKLTSTYTDRLQTDIVPATGRVHTSYHMTGTSTGRLSSSDPNLQNIPVRTEEGRKIREAFIAKDGYVLLSVDYSQVELRLAAAMAGVEALKQAFKDGVDIHALTASQVFDVPLDQVTPELRRQAKAVNFGIIYGISGWGLAKQLGCEPKDADSFIKRYLTRFNEIQDFMEASKEEARQNGFVKTLYGRKCVIAGINDKNGAVRKAAERQAINAPLQGTAADILKKAMIRMPAALKQAGFDDVKMLLQVHDELIFEVPEHKAEEVAALVCMVMEAVTENTLDVPLKAEAGWAKNWAQAH